MPARGDQRHNLGGAQVTPQHVVQGRRETRYSTLLQVEQALPPLQHATPRTAGVLNVMNASLDGLNSNVRPGAGGRGAWEAMAAPPWGPGGSGAASFSAASYMEVEEEEDQGSLRLAEDMGRLAEASLQIEGPGPRADLERLEEELRRSNLAAAWGPGGSNSSSISSCAGGGSSSSSSSSSTTTTGGVGRGSYYGGGASRAPTAYDPFQDTGSFAERDLLTPGKQSDALSQASISDSLPRLTAPPPAYKNDIQIEDFHERDLRESEEREAESFGRLTRGAGEDLAASRGGSGGSGSGVVTGTPTPAAPPPEAERQHIDSFAASLQHLSELHASPQQPMQRRTGGLLERGSLEQHASSDSSSSNSKVMGGAEPPFPGFSLSASSLVPLGALGSSSGTPAESSLPSHTNTARNIFLTAPSFPSEPAAPALVQQESPPGVGVPGRAAAAAVVVAAVAAAPGSSFSALLHNIPLVMPPELPPSPASSTSSPMAPLGPFFHSSTFPAPASAAAAEAAAAPFAHFSPPATPLAPPATPPAAARPPPPLSQQRGGG